MSAYKFAPLPSNSSVAGLVTMLVCAWFVTAGAVIVTEPSFAAADPVAHATAAERAVVIAPEARFTIKVEEQRLPRSASL